MAANATPRDVYLSPISQTRDFGEPAPAEQAKTFTWQQLDKKILRPFVEEDGRFDLPMGDGQEYVLPLVGFPMEVRVVTAEELLRRLQELVRYRLPWAKEQDVPESIHVDSNVGFMAPVTSSAHGLWRSVRRMALAGLLEEYPQDDMEGLLEGIRMHVFSGKPSLLEWRPLSLIPTEVVPEKKAAVLAGTKRKAAGNRASTGVNSKMDIRSIVNNEGNVLQAGSPPATNSSSATDSSSVADPSPRAKQLQTPSRTPSTGLDKDDDFEGGTRAKRARNVGKAGKNTRPGKAADKQGAGGLFGANLKKAFSHRAKTTDAIDAFPEAILPDSEPKVKVNATHDAFQKGSRRDRAAVGDTTGLHAYEVELCELADLSAAQYRCQKARTFCGLACFIGYNEHRRAEEPESFKRLQQFGTTQLQQCCNIDVNKATKLYLGFKDFGWLDQDMTKDIPRVWLERFHRAHREGLLREIRAWEMLTEEKKREGDKDLKEWKSSVLEGFKLDA